MDTTIVTDEARDLHHNGGSSSGNGAPAENAAPMGYREARRGSSVEPVGPAKGPDATEELHRRTQPHRTSYMSPEASDATGQPFVENKRPVLPTVTSRPQRGEIPRAGNAALERISVPPGAEGGTEVFLTPRPATMRIRRQPPSAYSAPLADIQITKVRSRAGSQAPSAAATPRGSHPSTVGQAAAHGIAAGVSQAQAAMERQMASRIQSRQASRMSRRFSPRGSFAARGSSEVVQQNLLQAREALRRFEEAAAAGRAAGQPSAAPIPQPAGQPGVRRQSVSEPHVEQAVAAQHERPHMAVTPPSVNRVTGLHGKASEPGAAQDLSPGAAEERVPGDARGQGEPAVEAPHGSRGEPPTASSRRTSQAEKGRLDTHRVERVQSEMMHLAQLDQEKRASRIASRMGSRPVSRHPASLSASAMVNRGDVAKAAAEELRRRIAAEQAKAPTAAAGTQPDTSGPRALSPRRRGQREMPPKLPHPLTRSDRNREAAAADILEEPRLRDGDLMASLWTRDFCAAPVHGNLPPSESGEDPHSSDSALGQTSLEEGGRGPVKTEDAGPRQSGSVMGRLFSTLFPVSSTDAPPPSGPRRRSFVPVISPSPRSSSQSSLSSSSRGSMRQTERQARSSSPPEEATATVPSQPAARSRRRPVRLGKYQEQLPWKALTVTYGTPEGLFHLWPQSDGASSASSLGTSSSGSNSGGTAGLYSSSTRGRARTFRGPLPRGRQHFAGKLHSQNVGEWRRAGHTESNCARFSWEGSETGLADTSESLSRMSSYYSSSGVMSPESFLAKDRRVPASVPVLDFSWLEKLASKRERRGLPPQPQLSRPAVHRKRVSSSRDSGRLAARLRKQQLSIAREVSSLAGHRSARFVRRMLSRRATLGPIGSGVPEKYSSNMEFTLEHPTSEKGVMLKRPASSYAAVGKRRTRGSLQGISGGVTTGRGLPAGRIRAPEIWRPRGLSASPERPQSPSLSSSLSFERGGSSSPETYALPEASATPRSPLAWLSHEGNTRKMSSETASSDTRIQKSAAYSAVPERPRGRPAAGSGESTSDKVASPACIWASQPAMSGRRALQSGGDQMLERPHSVLGTTAGAAAPTAGLRKSRSLKKKTAYGSARRKANRGVVREGYGGLYIAVEPVLEGCGSTDVFRGSRGDDFLVEGLEEKACRDVREVSDMSVERGAALVPVVATEVSSSTAQSVSKPSADMTKAARQPARNLVGRAQGTAPRQRKGRQWTLPTDARERLAEPLRRAARSKSVDTMTRRDTLSAAVAKRRNADAPETAYVITDNAGEERSDGEARPQAGVAGKGCVQVARLSGGAAGVCAQSQESVSIWQTSLGRPRVRAQVPNAGASARIDRCRAAQYATIKQRRCEGELEKKGTPPAVSIEADDLPAAQSAASAVARSPVLEKEENPTKCKAHVRMRLDEGRTSRRIPEYNRIGAVTIGGRPSFKNVGGNGDSEPGRQGGSRCGLQSGVKDEIAVHHAAEVAQGEISAEGGSLRVDPAEVDDGVCGKKQFTGVKFESQSSLRSAERAGLSAQKASQSEQATEHDCESVRPGNSRVETISRETDLHLRAPPQGEIGEQEHKHLYPAPQGAFKDTCAQEDREGGAALMIDEVTPTLHGAQHVRAFQEGKGRSGEDAGHEAACNRPDVVNTYSRETPLQEGERPARLEITGRTVEAEEAKSAEKKSSSSHWPAGVTQGDREVRLLRDGASQGGCITEALGGEDDKATNNRVLAKEKGGSNVYKGQPIMSRSQSRLEGAESGNAAAERAPSSDSLTWSPAEEATRPAPEDGTRLGQRSEQFSRFVTKGRLICARDTEMECIVDDGVKRLLSVLEGRRDAGSAFENDISGSVIVASDAKGRKSGSGLEIAKDVSESRSVVGRHVSPAERYSGSVPFGRASQLSSDEEASSPVSRNGSLLSPPDGTRGSMSDSGTRPLARKRERANPPDNDTRSAAPRKVTARGVSLEDRRASGSGSEGVEYTRESSSPERSTSQKKQHGENRGQQAVETEGQGRPLNATVKRPSRGGVEETQRERHMEVESPAEAPREPAAGSCPEPLSPGRAPRAVSSSDRGTQGGRPSRNVKDAAAHVLAEAQLHQGEASEASSLSGGASGERHRVPHSSGASDAGEEHRGRQASLEKQGSSKRGQQTCRWEPRGLGSCSSGHSAALRRVWVRSAGWEKGERVDLFRRGGRTSKISQRGGRDAAASDGEIRSRREHVPGAARMRRPLRRTSSGGRERRGEENAWLGSTPEGGEFPAELELVSRGGAGSGEAFSTGQLKDASIRTEQACGLGGASERLSGSSSSSSMTCIGATIREGGHVRKICAPVAASGKRHTNGLSPGSADQSDFGAARKPAAGTASKRDDDQGIASAWVRMAEAKEAPRSTGHEQTDVVTPPAHLHTLERNTADVNSSPSTELPSKIVSGPALSSALQVTVKRRREAGARAPDTSVLVNVPTFMSSGSEASANEDRAGQPRIDDDAQLLEHGQEDAGVNVGRAAAGREARADSDSARNLLGKRGAQRPLSGSGPGEAAYVSGLSETEHTVAATGTTEKPGLVNRSLLFSQGGKGAVEHTAERCLSPCGLASAREALVKKTLGKQGGMVPVAAKSRAATALAVQLGHPPLGASKQHLLGAQLRSSSSETGSALRSRKPTREGAAVVVEDLETPASRRRALKRGSSAPISRVRGAGMVERSRSVLPAAEATATLISPTTKSPLEHRGPSVLQNASASEKVLPLSRVGSETAPEKEVQCSPRSQQRWAREGRVGTAESGIAHEGCENLSTGIRTELSVEGKLGGDAETVLPASAWWTEDRAVVPVNQGSPAAPRHGSVDSTGALTMQERDEKGFTRTNNSAIDLQSRGELNGPTLVAKFVSSADVKETSSITEPSTYSHDSPGHHVSVRHAGESFVPRLKRLPSGVAAHREARGALRSPVEQAVSAAVIRPHGSGPARTSLGKLKAAGSPEASSVESAIKPSVSMLSAEKSRTLSVSAVTGGAGRVDAARVECSGAESAPRAALKGVVPSKAFEEVSAAPSEDRVLPETRAENRVVGASDSVSAAPLQPTVLPRFDGPLRTPLPAPEKEAAAAHRILSPGKEFFRNPMPALAEGEPLQPPAQLPDNRTRTTLDIAASKQLHSPVSSAQLAGSSPAAPEKRHDAAVGTVDDKGTSLLQQSTLHFSAGEPQETRVVGGLFLAGIERRGAEADQARWSCTDPTVAGEEGEKGETSGVSVAEVRDDADGSDSTICASPPFSPRYVPPSAPPPRPAVPQLNLYWLHTSSGGSKKRCRLQDVIRGLHAAGLCSVSQPQISAVTLPAGAPRQVDDDLNKKKADIVASLFDDALDSDTGGRRPRPPAVGTGDPPPCGPTIRGPLGSSMFRPKREPLLDLERSPELKAPRGEHPPIFRRREAAENVITQETDHPYHLPTSRPLVSAWANDNETRLSPLTGSPEEAEGFCAKNENLQTSTHIGRSAGVPPEAVVGDSLPEALLASSKQVGASQCVASGKAGAGAVEKGGSAVNAAQGRAAQYHAESAASNPSKRLPEKDSCDLPISLLARPGTKKDRDASDDSSGAPSTTVCARDPNSATVQVARGREAAAVARRSPDEREIHQPSSEAEVPHGVSPTAERLTQTLAATNAAVHAPVDKTLCRRRADFTFSKKGAGTAAQGGKRGTLTIALENSRLVTGSNSVLADSAEQSGFPEAAPGRTPREAAIDPLSGAAAWRQQGQRHTGVQQTMRLDEGHGGFERTLKKAAAETEGARTDVRREAAAERPAVENRDMGETSSKTESERTESASQNSDISQTVIETSRLAAGPPDLPSVEGRSSASTLRAPALQENVRSLKKSVTMLLRTNQAMGNASAAAAPRNLEIGCHRKRTPATQRSATGESGLLDKRQARLFAEAAQLQTPEHSDGTNGAKALGSTGYQREGKCPTVMGGRIASRVKALPSVRGSGNGNANAAGPPSRRDAPLLDADSRGEDSEQRLPFHGAPSRGNLVVAQRVRSLDRLARSRQSRRSDSMTSDGAVVLAGPRHEPAAARPAIAATGSAEVINSRSQITEDGSGPAEARTPEKMYTPRRRRIGGPLKEHAETLVVNATRLRETAGSFSPTPAAVARSKGGGAAEGHGVGSPVGAADACRLITRSGCGGTAVTTEAAEFLSSRTHDERNTATGLNGAGASVKRVSTFAGEASEYLMRASAGDPRQTSKGPFFGKTPEKYGKATSSVSLAYTTGSKRRASHSLGFAPSHSRDPRLASDTCRTRAGMSPTYGTFSTISSQQNPSESLEEAKAVFLQSWWKAVTVRKWVDAAKCVRDFETTSSAESPRAVSVPEFGLYQHGVVPSCMTSSDHAVLPCPVPAVPRRAACGVFEELLAPATRRRRFADLLFKALGATYHNDQIPFTPFLTVPPHTSAERVHSEPGCTTDAGCCPYGSTSITGATTRFEAERFCKKGSCQHWSTSELGNLGEYGQDDIDGELSRVPACNRLGRHGQGSYCTGSRCFSSPTLDIREVRRACRLNTAKPAGGDGGAGGSLMALAPVCRLPKNRARVSHADVREGCRAARETQRHRATAECAGPYASRVEAGTAGLPLEDGLNPQGTQARARRTAARGSAVPESDEQQSTRECARPAGVVGEGPFQEVRTGGEARTPCAEEQTQVVRSESENSRPPESQRRKAEGRPSSVEAHLRHAERRKSEFSRGDKPESRCNPVVDELRAEGAEIAVSSGGESICILGPEVPPGQYLKLSARRPRGKSAEEEAARCGLQYTERKNTLPGDSTQKAAHAATDADDSHVFGSNGLGRAAEDFSLKLKQRGTPSGVLAHAGLEEDWDGIEVKRGSKSETLAAECRPATGESQPGTPAHETPAAAREGRPPESGDGDPTIECTRLPHTVVEEPLQQGRASGEARVPCVEEEQLESTSESKASAGSACY